MSPPNNPPALRSSGYPFSDSHFFSLRLSSTPRFNLRPMPPPIQPLFRAQLRSTPANGHVAFVPQLRKLVFEYCDKWPSSASTRTYLLNHLQPLARSNPHVEVVVKQRNHKEPIVRGFYVNGRDKVVPLNRLEVTGVAKKVELLLDASGAKIKPLKRRVVESTTEAARGIWSGLHADPPRL